MADLENSILYVFSIFFVILTTFLLVDYTQSVDTSSWNFTGYQLAVNLLPYLPVLFLAVACGVIILAVVRRNR